ncbi:hypothetical protein S7335_277 [Synechococcus sp. PCC 7335]|uniref:hypothetical protein n=1 Tax=Synechococcus sp. (strain ATCC 29403 / PCC 7335) TaxID=91464 RepID=UPI00017ECB5D|nr:hypothetical protein [Synechococcus sp. PCC 7335]EDX83099.1 hypothetical protein S7335_277 [Synechococcus sp. PCC 7335]
MWTTFTITLILSVTMGYLFFVTSNKHARFLEGLIAVGSMLACLGISPVPIKILLIFGILAMEQWRVRWETTHQS